MSFEPERDPMPDPELGAHLHAVLPDPAAHAPDWDGLRARLRERAALSLARLRRQRRAWWQYAAAWARPAIPAAVAAAALLAVVLGRQPEPLPALAERPGLEDVLGAPVPELEYDLLFEGSALSANEALLRAAFYER